MKSKKYLAGVLVAVLVIVAMLLPACAPAPPEETAPPEEAAPPEQVTPPMTLKCSHAFTPKMAGMVLWMKWAEEITEHTGGAVQFEWYHGGALSKPGEEQEHCKSGVVDMVGTSATWYSYMPLWEMNGALPFQPSDTLLAVKTKMQLYEEFPELRAEVENMNMKLMFIGPYGDFSIMSRPKLETLDDFEGVKVGVLGRQQPGWIEPIGGIPSFVSGPARYENLEKGVVDASLMGGISTHYAFRTHELCDYYLECGLGQYCSFFYAMNQDTWNKFSPADQRFIEQLNKEVMYEWFPEQVPADEVTFRGLMEEEGVTFLTLSNEERAKWANALPNLAKAWVDEAADATGRELRKRMWLRYLEITEEGGHEWPMDWSNVD